MKQADHWVDARVVSTEDIAEDVRRVCFAPEAELPGFDPGSHLRIEVPLGGGTTLRSYTCVPSPEGTLGVAVKRRVNSRGGSAYIWSLSEGDRVRVTLPENRFALSWRAPQYLLLAGGIGITPILGMARALTARGADVALHYGAERPGAMAYRAELEALLGERARFYSDADGERPDLHGLIAELHPEAELYMCGPLPMLEAAKSAWAAAGRPISRLRYEVFGDSGAHAERPFEVEVAGLERTVTVAEDETLLSALLEAGVEMIYDCQRGECGLCSVDVLEASGTLDHRDVFFSESEKQAGDKMCACVSRLVGGKARIDIGYRA
ncbi:PDR/VanB family oxidoreductase [Roseivivax sp.]